MAGHSTGLRGQSHKGRALELVFGWWYESIIVSLYIVTLIEYICVENYIHQPGDESEHEQMFVCLWRLMSCFHSILLE